MRFFKKTNFKFMEKRNTLYIISGVVIAAGLISLFVKGLDLGIDFLGGTELIVKFQNEVAIGDVRGAMAGAGLGEAEIKTF
jgi:preprotein translocase subunit SecF